MPVFQKLIDFDEMVSQLTTPPIFVNDLLSATEEQKDYIRDLISTRYSGDMLSVLPTCRCGNMKGKHLIGDFCDHCGTVVKSVIDEDIEPIVWFKSPEGVRKLINPIIWIMLSNRFTISGFNVLHWICDTTYRVPVKQPKVMGKIQELNITRGYNHFVDNFDEILELLFTIKEFNKPKNGEYDYLRSLLRDNRKIIFSNYLPLPNKSLLIIEKTNVGIYVDPAITGAIDAIQMVISIDTSIVDHTQRTKENRTIKALNKLAEFYEAYIKNSVAGKRGIMRKHVYGSRTHFSFRAVVTSITDAHDYNELHVPWGIGVSAFRPHLMNKLLKMGYDHNQAVGFLNSHIESTHPILEMLLDQLIAESPIYDEKTGKRGIPVLMQRNKNVSFSSNTVDKIPLTHWKSLRDLPTKYG